MEANDQESIGVHEDLDVFIVNGITVCTVPNKRPENSIEMRLLVNTGSLMEGEDEQGLAHFVEHLGFKGTKNFAGYELVKTLESLGITYGPDLNASTHLLETNYKLSIRLDPELSQLRIAVNILKEWAFDMNLSDTDISEEKNVIMSEYVAKRGLGARLLDTYWKRIFENDIGDKSALVARRMPIGIPSVFMSASSTQIRHFYQSWYRPDNMAILIVGDIFNQQNDIRRIVVECFSPSPTPAPVPPPFSSNPGLISQCTEPSSSRNTHEDMSSLLATIRTQVSEYLVLPNHHSRDIAIYMADRELTTAQISFECFSPIALSRSRAFVKEDLMHRLMASVVDKRLNEIIKRRATLPGDIVSLPSGECPWLSVGLSIREFVRGLRCVALTATLRTMHPTLCGVAKDTQDGEEEKTEGGPDSPVPRRLDSFRTPAKNGDAGAAVRDECPSNDHWAEVVSYALRALMVETRRMRDWGIHIDELQAAKQKWTTLFVDQRDRGSTTTATVVSDLTAHVLSGGRTVFASPVQEACLCLEAMESVSVEDMNRFLGNTLDMDVSDDHSRYYIAHTGAGTGVGDKIPRGMFRALSGQFPGANAFLSGQAADESLRRALLDAREFVASLPGVEQWPVPQPMQAEVVIRAAQLALGRCVGSDGPVNDTSMCSYANRRGAQVHKGVSPTVAMHASGRDAHREVAFPALEESMQVCACCQTSLSFLPKDFLSHEPELKDGSMGGKKKKNNKSSTTLMRTPGLSVRVAPAIDHVNMEQLDKIQIVETTTGPPEEGESDGMGNADMLGSSSLCAEAAATALSSNPHLPPPMIVNSLHTIDSYEFLLPNGMTVCAKWMPEDAPGKVSFQGFALGGSTELSEVEDVVMSFLDTMAYHSCMRVSSSDVVDYASVCVSAPEQVTRAPSGISSGKSSDSSDLVLHPRDLADILSVTNVGVNTQRHFNHRGIGGSGPVDNFELLLSLLALKLTSQCIDEKAFDDMVSQQRSFLTFRNNSPEQQFMERARLLTCGDMEIARPLSEEVLALCTLEMARKLYTRAFLLDPTEFTFVFIGDLPPQEEVQRLFSIYLGSLRPLPASVISELGGRWVCRAQEQLQAVQQPSGKHRGGLTECHPVQRDEDTNASQVMEQQGGNDEDEIYPFTRLGRSFRITQSVHETIRLRQADNASTLVVFRVELRKEENEEAEESDLRNVIALDAACQSLQNALLTELRIRLGKVYSVLVEFSRGSLSHIAMISISLVCDPSHLDQIRCSMEEQVAHARDKGPDAMVLSGIVESMCNKHTKSLKSPSHWMFWILDSYKSFRVYAWLAAARRRVVLSGKRAEDGIVSGSDVHSTVLCSSKWVNRFAGQRSVGKIDDIRNVVNVYTLRSVYKKMFDLTKSVHMNLCPLQEQSDDASGVK